jgi:hypothetical protein
VRLGIIWPTLTKPCLNPTSRVSLPALRALETAREDTKDAGLPRTSRNGLAAGSRRDGRHLGVPAAPARPEVVVFW